MAFLPCVPKGEARSQPRPRIALACSRQSRHACLLHGL